MSLLILRGGGQIEASVSFATVVEARDRGDEWLTVFWQPDYTPHDPSSFKLRVLVDEIVGVRESGR